MNTTTGIVMHRECSGSGVLYTVVDFNKKERKDKMCKWCTYAKQRPVWHSNLKEYDCVRKNAKLIGLRNSTYPGSADIKPEPVAKPSMEIKRIIANAWEKRTVKGKKEWVDTYWVALEVCICSCDRVCVCVTVVLCMYVSLILSFSFEPGVGRRPLR